MLRPRRTGNDGEFSSTFQSRALQILYKRHSFAPARKEIVASAWSAEYTGAHAPGREAVRPAPRSTREQLVCAFSFHRGSALSLTENKMLLLRQPEKRLRIKHLPELPNSRPSGDSEQTGRREGRFNRMRSQWIKQIEHHFTCILAGFTPNPRAHRFSSSDAFLCFCGHQHEQSRARGIMHADGW